MLSKEDIKKIAHLARLEIADQEIEALGVDLDRILQLVAQMNQIDATHIKPLAHPLDVNQPLRDDQITETNQRELLQRNAPKTFMGLYIVPKVIETE